MKASSAGKVLTPRQCATVLKAMTALMTIGHVC